MDAVSGVVLRRVKNDMGVRSAAWNPSWTKLATSSFPFESYPRICIADMASGVVEHEIAHGDNVRAVAWNRSGTKLVTVCSDNHLRVVDATIGKVELDLAWTCSPFAAVWSPSGGSSP